MKQSQASIIVNIFIVKSKCSFVGQMLQVCFKLMQSSFLRQKQSNKLRKV